MTKQGPVKNEWAFKSTQAKFFNTLSQTFLRDAVQTSLPGDYTNTVADVIAESFSEDFGGRALDLGCGLGQNAIRIASLSPRAEVVGVDISLESLRRAKLAAKSVGLSARLSFVASDNEHLPFRGVTFNATVIIGTLHHSFNPLAVVTELRISMVGDAPALVVEPSMGNPIRKIGWLLWECVPSRVKRNMRDLGENEGLPDFVPITPNKLVHILQSAGFRVTFVKSAWLFVFVLAYFETFPAFRKLLNRKFAAGLASIDRLLTTRGLWRFSGAFLIIKGMTGLNPEAKRGIEP